MKIDRHHVPWAIFVSIATLILGALYVAEFHPKAVPMNVELPRILDEAPRERNSFGASPLGLLYGSIALAIFLFASALGIRKKRRLWRIGNVQLWLRAHIWLSILTIPLVLFHSGFQVGGPHTTTVMILYAFVMVSGFFGLALQNFMPKLMKDRLSREVVYEQIPHVRKRIAEAAAEFRTALLGKIAPPKSAAELAAAQAAAADEGGVVTAPVVDEYASESVLLEFLDEECLPYLQGSRFSAARARLGDNMESDDVFRLLRLNVAEEYRPKVDEIQTWCDDRRLTDLQTRLHHWLHGWLIIHVPASFALLVFTFWHAYVTWVYL